MDQKQSKQSTGSSRKNDSLQKSAAYLQLKEDLAKKSYVQQKNHVRPHDPFPSAVQARGDLDCNTVKATAAEGFRGGSSSLPHQEAIQKSFGKHDVSSVQAYVGGPAKEASHTMQASAYASGNQVAFADQPSLHKAAHEAAHVVQQRSGVSLKGGVGQAGDQYEKHADAVADRVIQNKNSEALLGQVSAANQVTSGNIQKFGTSEHIEMGDGATKEDVTLGPNVKCSFGEFNALPDYFESVQQIKDLAKIPGKTKNTDEEVRYILDVKVRDNKENKDKYNPDAVKVCEDRYLVLAGDNKQHYATPNENFGTHPADRPLSSGNEYHKGHEKAINTAFTAGYNKTAGKTQEGVSVNDFMLEEGWASHFLQDCFASGHIMAPRQSAKTFWEGKYPMFWENFKWWMAQQVAQKISDASSVMSVDLCFHGMGVKGALETIQDMTEGKPETTLGDLVGLAVHDYFNKVGVNATADGKNVEIYGDGGLGKGDTKKIAVAAVKKSLQEVKDVYEAGKSAKSADEVEALKVKLKDAQNHYVAENSMPRVNIPDTGDRSALVWEVGTVDDLLSNDKMKEALRLSVDEIVVKTLREVGEGIDDEEKKKAFMDGVVNYINDKPFKAVKEIVNYTPSTGGGVNGHNTDDNAMDYIAKAKNTLKDKGGLAKLTADQKFKLIKDLIPGSCDDPEEQAIVDLLDTCLVGEMESIVSKLGSGSYKKGVDYLDSGIDGAEWDDLCGRVFSKSTNLAKFADDNAVRIAISAGRHKNADLSTLKSYAKNLLDGGCGDDDENALITMFDDLSNTQVESIIDYVTYSRIWDKIDGSESSKMTKVLKRKRYFARWTSSSMSSWVKYHCSGSTNDNAQEAICCILESANSSEFKKIVDDVGNWRLNYNLTGSHQDRYDDLK